MDGMSLSDSGASADASSEQGVSAAAVPSESAASGAPTEETRNLRRNWIAGGLGVLGLVLIGYAGISDPEAPNPTHDYPILEVSQARFEDEAAGEVPLFDSQVPQVRAPSAAPLTPEPAPPVQPFDAVTQDHWIVQALREVSPDVLDPSLGGEHQARGTRYELAVTLARVFEAYEDSREPQQELDLSRLALLEKASKELRTELDMLGVDRTRLGARLEALGERVGQVEEGLGSQEARLAQLEEKLAGMSQVMKAREEDHEQLAARVAAGEAARGTLETRTKAVTEVLGRMVVKSSVAQARVARLSEEVAAGDAGDASLRLRALGRRVEALEKAPGGKGGALTAAVQERIKRLERLMVKVYDRRQEAASDPQALENVRRSIGQLARRLEGGEARAGPAPTPASYAASTCARPNRGCRSTTTPHKHDGRTRPPTR